MNSEPLSGKPLRILSLDGGGMRGLYTATLLSSLASSLCGKGPRDIGKAFDLIVGTSTGGILAAALANGVPIEKIIDLYQNIGPKIFTDPQPKSNLPSKPHGLFKQMCWVLRALQDPFLAWCFRNKAKAANNPQPLREELSQIFQKTTFLELYEKRKIGLCLTAVKMLDEKIRVFKTPHIEKKNWDNDLTLVDACIASSAAPLFLPLASIPSPQRAGLEEIFVDGGLAANNPVLIGLIEALHINGDQPREIQIFSIGTCSAPEGTVMSSNDVNCGLMQWKAGAKALSVSMNAQASAANYAAHFFAEWFKKHSNTPVHIVRFPEERLSEANLQFLKMDNASKECCTAFMSFGNDDAMAAKRICDQETPEGKMIISAFKSMPELKEEP